MNLETVLNGLAATLDNMTGVTVSARPPDVEQLPQAFVSDLIITPHADFDGDFDLLVEVTFLLSEADSEAAWDAANAMLSSASTTSIYGVLNASPSLGGVAASSRLVSMHGFRYDVVYADNPYFGFTAQIAIYC